MKHPQGTPHGKILRATCYRACFAACMQMSTILTCKQSRFRLSKNKSETKTAPFTIPSREENVTFSARLKTEM